MENLKKFITRYCGWWDSNPRPPKKHGLSTMPFVTGISGVLLSLFDHLQKVNQYHTQTMPHNNSLSLVVTSFAPRDSPRSLKKKLAMSPSSIGHGGQYNNTKYSPFDWILRAAFAGESFFFLREPACKAHFLQAVTLIEVPVESFSVFL